MQTDVSEEMSDTSAEWKYKNRGSKHIPNVGAEPQEDAVSKLTGTQASLRI
jgi:hypothetical protein